MSQPTFGWESAGIVPTITLHLANSDDVLPKRDDKCDRLLRLGVEKCRAQGRDLIVAALMVRNEAHTIVDTLHSLRDVADALVLLDTGSSDNTVALAQKFSSEQCWPASIFERTFEPFDFSQARNHLLERCAESHASEFIFLADAHDRVHGARYLRALCAKHVLEQRGTAHSTPEALDEPQWGKQALPAAVCTAAKLDEIKSQARTWDGVQCAKAKELLPCHYFLAVDFLVSCESPSAGGGAAAQLVTKRQPMVRLIRSVSGWRYSGPVHEVLWNDWWLYAQRVAIPPEKCKIVQDKRNDSDGSQRRWPRDLQAIDAFLQLHPSHPQALYYCGKTQRALQQFNEAVQSLAARLRAVSRAQDSALFQRHNAHYLLAECLFLQAMRAIRCHRAEAIDAAVAQSIEDHCWQAFELRQRAEPLLLLAKLQLYRKQAWRMLATMLLTMRLCIDDVEPSEAHSVTAYKEERDSLYQKALQLTQSR